MDAKLIEQVLINLLDNAIKHTPPDCEISVSASEEKNTATFSVADRGCGIAVSELPNIFKMFYTTRSGEADAQRGVGLGLTICEAIVKAHGGIIEGLTHRRSGYEICLLRLPMEVKIMENRNEQILIVEDVRRSGTFICYSRNRRAFLYDNRTAQGAVHAFSEQI
jgi:two-component system sensor histidine kinase KdpD